MSLLHVAAQVFGAKEKWGSQVAGQTFQKKKRELKETVDQNYY
jgi:hypothetical protein